MSPDLFSLFRELDIEFAHLALLFGDCAVDLERVLVSLCERGT
jgi:hypothetical protein